MLKKSIILILIGLFSVMVTSAQEATVNLLDTCVTEYDESVDYFPDKVEVTTAENFSVEYHNNYKVVTVLNGEQTFTYVLVQCGTPAPDSADVPADARVHEVPSGEFVALSTTQLPHLTELGLLDQLVALDTFLYTSTDEVQALIEAGELIEVSPNFELNMEIMLTTDADLVMTDAFDPARLTMLEEAGLFAVVNTDYLETTPLGRAEWIKFTSLFYNEEADANTVYDGIATRYTDAVALAATIPVDDQPVVLMNTFSSWDSAWIIPGAQTYAGRLILDAGAQIALGEDAPDQSAFVSFEVIYDQALDADFWILNAFGITDLDSLIAQDERYADFTASVWNNDLDVNVNGGNNYYELGVLKPDLILMDLIAIFHPDLLPDHSFTFFRPLTQPE